MTKISRNHACLWSTFAAALLCVPMLSQFVSAASSDPDRVKPPTVLNNELQTEVVIPAGRPAWVEEAPVQGKEIDEVAVCSEPFTTPAACRAALDQKIERAVADYIAEQTNSKLASQMITYNLGEIKQRLVPSENYYEETIVSPSVGPMHQIHARIQFPIDFRNEVAERWLQVRSAARLGQVGLCFLAVLGLFSTVAGFFRADNATRGYYTRRLQFAAVGAILGMIVLGAVVARWIPWI